MLEGLILNEVVLSADSELPFRYAKNDFLIYAYGAYGQSSLPLFDDSLFSLLDRGVVYAICHARGGSELGWNWYLSGKMMNKRNTFLDVIDCADYFVKKGWTSHDQIAINGASAGGLMVSGV